MQFRCAWHGPALRRRETPVTSSTLIDIRTAEASGEQPRRWRRQVDRSHALASTFVLAGAVLVALAWPSAVTDATAWGGAALLVGGALIGVPHGSSDFVVAHRAFEPTFSRGWLPMFLVGYLTIVALVLLSWAAAPLATLLAFIVLSCLHFGRGDLGAEDHGEGLTLAVRATTPLLPVLLLHPGGVEDLIASLAGMGEPSVARAIDALRWPLLLPWAGLLSCVLVPRVLWFKRDAAGKRRRDDALETLAIADAAVVLPPLLAFALYFCLVHAVRHMIAIADTQHPHDARRAALLVATLVIPSAAVCLAALALTWGGLAGELGTEDMLVWSLRIIAALTVPHMALEAWVERSDRRSR